MGVGSTDLGAEALLVQLLKGEGFAPDATAAPGPRPSQAPAPAGPAQRRFWIQEQIETAAGLNNLGCLIRFAAPLDRPALDRALAALAARHEVLRTRFEEQDGEILEIVEPAAAPPLEELSAAAAGPGQTAAALAFVERPYALDRAPLWRAALPAAAGDALLFGCHHIILDWTGLQRLLGELAGLYADERAGRRAELPPVALQQADYSHWLGREARRRRLEDDRAYWRERLAGPLPALDLPAATPAGRTARCRSVPLELDPALTAAVRRFAAARRSTVFQVLLAAYAGTLGRFALAEEVVVGTSVDHRDGPATEAIVGCLTDLLPLRCDLSGAPGFGALVERLHAATAEDFAHQALGFAELVELAAPERRADMAPLFQALFNLLPAAAGDGLGIEPLQTSLARADLALELADSGGRIAGRLEYREGLIAPAVAEALAGALACLLRHGLTEPERPVNRLPLLEPEPAAARLEHVNPPPPAAPAETLAQLFVAGAERRPAAVALIEGEREVTYGELLARSTALAERLVEAGLEPGRPVAFALERSVDFVVALLATLQGAGVALPLDLGHPGERLAAMVADSGAALLVARGRPAWLTTEGCRVVGPDAPPAKGLALPQARPEDAAYLIYTSGSTGRPKGVFCPQRGAVNRLAWMAGAFPFAADERGCLKTSPAFADFAAELFGPLLAGCPVVIADRATAQDPQALTALIRERRVTRLVLVPSLLRIWLDGLPDLGERLASLRVCVSSGEALPAELAARFRARLPRCRLLNLYGSSEVSADATWYEVEGDEQDRVPLGRPIPGNRVAVVDEAGQVLPSGAPGEIVIGGLGVSNGYLNAPETTAERFGGFGPAALGTPRFRTGDLGFHDAEGRLIGLGRRDRQMKVHGVRIEPGEIEAVLARHPEVRESLVLVLGAGEAAGLVAYVAGPPGLEPETLRGFLAARLPRALVPTHYVILERLPLNANGKLDLAALPAPAATGRGRQVRRGVLDPLEALLAEAWGSVLGTAVETAEADFFALGGSSLQAILAMTRLGVALGRPLPVAWLFETPRLAELAQRVAADPEAEQAPLPPPAASRHGGTAPATVNQAWLWEEYRQDPGRIAYNLPIAYRLDGPLDADALDAAVSALVARHESLRTRLEEDETGLVQRVDPAPASLLARHDLSSAAEPEAALQALIEQVGRQPFALDRERPFRALLARLGEQRHCLVMVLHHVAGDGWSGQLLVEQLAALYRARLGGGEPPAPPRLQCGDVARWQQRIRPLLAGRLERYQASLAGAEAPRLAGLRTGAASGGPVGIAPVPLPAAPVERFYRLGAGGRATPFVLMLAAWAALLSRFGDVERPLLTTPFAGRGLAELKPVVGFLANPVLLAVDLRDSPSFDETIAAARRALLEGLRHEEVPPSWIQAGAAGWPGGGKGTGEALRSMLIVEDARLWRLELPGVTARLVAAPQSPEARVDLALVVTATDEGPQVRLEYAGRRVPAALAERLARGLAALIDGAAADPATPLDRLPLGEGAAPLLAARSVAPAEARLDALLARQAAERPEAAALCDGRGDLSYAELERRAAAIAGRLQALGVAPGDRVALVAAASPRQAAGLLGIWRAGATAVPLDPAYPSSRIAWTLADAGVVAALAEGPLDYPCPQLRLDEAAAGQPARCRAAPGLAPAAVIYTSGTSGRPKGVLLDQAALCRLGAALAEAYALQPGDRLLQVVSPAFDVALSDLAMALAAGATLVAAPREAVMPGRSLAATLAGQAITHLQAPAAVLGATEPGALPALRVVAVGGEVCPPETARRWAAGRRLFLLYGPSEATVTAALAPWDETARAGTLGRPFCGARLAVLDAAGAPLPPGVPGELAIAGPGVALGYLGRPGLTAERFQPDPDGGPGARRYRTGDRVRLEEDGTLTFLGRLDRQVKLRGFRIEPGETEAALAARPGVARALAAVRGDALGERRLLAWAVPAAGARLDGAALRRELRRILPDHLVPALIVEVAEVPLTPNGKVDWDRLPVPAAAPPRAAPAPRTPLPQGEAAIRRELAAIWATLLGREEVGLDVSFFDVGGHSLLVVKLQERLAERFGVELPIGELFAHPTLRRLAARLQEALPAPKTGPETAGAVEDFTL
ncbi:amino acid adenylation domain-containing protein [Tistlia consotensis]|uniref:Amino acid adenylation domain-containing protein n=1 Tax=Tistlia consotensis USBA 355 TaxID=560819 RepID=A0A1Y6B8B5_9PROT|nr:non-ribosomal peptide synthetase [Tistlia consotensis]SME90659.1 amino acid adenylation domain-containing protein [Tistlia consotensis USBA 355]SNR26861.1 amino acid adenylation domain-containing protein [Tistlia consotensis]